MGRAPIICDEMQRCGMPGDLALVLWGSRVRGGGGGGEAGFGDQPVQVWAPSMADPSCLGVMESSGRLPRYSLPRPVLEGAGVAWRHTQSREGYADAACCASVGPA